MRIDIHRGGGEIGGVALELSLDGRSLLLDCGVGGSRGESWIDDLASSLEVWVSHAHLDHVGAFPEVTRGRPRLRGTCSGPTRRLARHTLATLADCSEERAEAVAAALERVEDRTWFDVLGGRGRAMAFRAGHVAGARMLLVETDGEGDNLLYTGDFCGHDQMVVGGAELPSFGDGGLGTLVMEGVLATDRDADDVSWNEAFDGLANRVVRGPGPALVAAGAVGEVCELAAGFVRRGHTVGAPERLAALFDLYERKGGDVDWREVELLDAERLVRYADTGGTVVAPSAGLSADSEANRVAGVVADASEGRIAMVNGPPRRTPGAALLEADVGERVDGLPGRPANCAEVWSATLPTHAPRWQLVETAAMLDPSRVVLVHGRTSQLHALGRAIRERAETEVVVPDTGEAIELA